MKQEIAKKEDQKNGCGECIFCLTQCPECGSRNINVVFKPEFDYTLFKRFSASPREIFTMNPAIIKGTALF
jgi:hypothetical protein